MDVRIPRNSANLYKLKGEVSCFFLAHAEVMNFDLPHLILCCHLSIRPDFGLRWYLFSSLIVHPLVFLLALILPNIISYCSCQKYVLKSFLWEEVIHQCCLSLRSAREGVNTVVEEGQILHWRQKLTRKEPLIKDNFKVN